MFDSLKGMAGVAGLLKDLPKIKSKMEQVKRELADVLVESQTGGGAVRVTANGQMRVTAVRVDQAMLATLVDATNPDDRALAEDLIAGAVNNALEKAKEAAARKFSEAAEDLNLPIPAGGLGGLLG